MRASRARSQFPGLSPPSRRARPVPWRSRASVPVAGLLMLAPSAERLRIEVKTGSPSCEIARYGPP